MRTYKVVRRIPFVNIEVGSIIAVADYGKVSYNGEEVPINVDKLLHDGLIQLVDAVPLFDNGKKVVLFDGEVGKIVTIKDYNYNGKSKQYEIIMPNRKTYIVDEKVLRPVEYYWFVNSKGIKQQEFLYRDVKADNWRKRIGNFFTDTNECEKYRMKICEQFPID